MEPSPSPEKPLPLTDAAVDTLFELADLGVRAGLAGRPAPALDPAALAPALRDPRGVFVTVEVGGELNGCIGTMEPVEPLGPAVARLAWAAAFDDPRLPALQAEDYPSVEFKLSVISPLEPVPAASEAEVMARLRPGVDGLVIRSGSVQATFLPAVWAKVPDAVTFFRQLQKKAGLRPGSWPPGMQTWRYTAIELRRRAADMRGDGSGRFSAA